MVSDAAISSLDIAVGSSLETLVLPDHETERLAEALSAVPSPMRETEPTLLVLYSVFAQLPRDILGRLLDFGRAATSPAAILLRGLPADANLPSTQNDGLPNRSKKTFISELCLLGITQLLGEPIGFLSDKDGRLVHDLVPVPGREGTLSNQGSTRFLVFHNDLYYDDIRRYHYLNPDFLVLIGLRADPDGLAYTYFADAKSICEHLNARDLELLRRPLYRMNAPHFHCLNFANGEDVLSEPMAVISGPSALPEIALASNGVRTLNRDAKSALGRLYSICSRPDVASRFLLQPGEALLINNRKGVHARSVFRPHYDGTDRWLQRAQARRSLWELRHRSVSGHRVYS